MGKVYQPYVPEQSFLLPPNPRDWLPEDHLAYFILSVVEELDLSAIYAHYERELRGQPPYHPQMVVGLLLYAYCIGVPSSRKIEARTYEDVAFRVIAAGQHPDHTRISEFRRIHLKALAELFVQILRLCQKAGMVKLGHVSLDGTKQKANASKHKAMSYGRMKQDEDKLRTRVKELMAEAERVDAAEDEAEGQGWRRSDLPEDLRHAKTRLERIRALKRELEREAASQQEGEASGRDGKDGEAGPPPSASSGSAPELPSNKIPTTEDGKPTEKAQRNFSDADSRIMKTNDGFVQGYNCQAAVDEAHQVIVGQAVTNQSPDPEHLPAMVAQVKDNCGGAPAKLSADSGYFSEENVRYATEQGSDPYIATGRKKHGEAPVVVKGRPPANLTVKDRMARKVATKAGAAIYARRKVIVEPVFGQIKEARGFRRFLLRGLEKVRGEWSLITLTHNLLKLFGLQKAHRVAGEAGPTVCLA